MALGPTPRGLLDLPTETIERIFSFVGRASSWYEGCDTFYGELAHCSRVCRRLQEVAFRMSEKEVHLQYDKQLLPLCRALKKKVTTRMPDLSRVTHFAIWFYDMDLRGEQLSFVLRKMYNLVTLQFAFDWDTTQTGIQIQAVFKNVAMPQLESFVMLEFGGEDEDLRFHDRWRFRKFDPTKFAASAKMCTIRLPQTLVLLRAPVKTAAAVPSTDSSCGRTHMLMLPAAAEQTLLPERYLGFEGGPSKQWTRLDTLEVVDVRRRQVDRQFAHPVQAIYRLRLDTLRVPSIEAAEDLFLSCSGLTHLQCHRLIVGDGDDLNAKRATVMALVRLSGGLKTLKVAIDCFYPQDCEMMLVNACQSRSIELKRYRCLWAEHETEPEDDW